MTHRRRPIAYATVGEQPFSEINTTPIIDVMLVLLIMFIITLPLITHSVKIDLPPPGTVQRDPLTHRLALDSASRITWDGVSIAESDLPGRLAAYREAAGREDLLLFRAEAETRYEDFNRVLAHVKRRVQRLSFDRNDRFARAY